MIWMQNVYNNNAMHLCLEPFVVTQKLNNSLVCRQYNDAMT